MGSKHTILLIEDDSDDKDIFEIVLDDLEIKNEFVWCQNADEAYNYLCTPGVKMFIIFCDINLPGKSGLEFKMEIDKVPELRKKSIPFVFYSTSASPEQVKKAYLDMTIQGFFVKGINYNEIKNDIKIIFDYWTRCQHPNL